MMDADKLLDALGHVDPELIQAADAAPQGGSPGRAPP